MTATTTKMITRLVTGLPLMYPSSDRQRRRTTRIKKPPSPSGACLEKHSQTVDADAQRAAASAQRTAQEKIHHVDTSLNTGLLDERPTVCVPVVCHTALSQAQRRSVPCDSLPESILPADGRLVRPG